MNRRTFLSTTSAGLAVVTINPGVWDCANPFSEPRSYKFRRYRPGNTIGDIWQVTPSDGFYTNTYYDVCPWSPSGRYLAVTRLPYQDRITVLGDRADICIIDLEEQHIRTVYTTRSWGYQLGGNLHWGNNDRYLFTNDVIDNQHAVGVRIDLETEETLMLTGPQYDVDPWRQTVIGPTLEYLNVTQYAYGPPAVAASENSFERLPPGAAPDEGLWEIEITTGKKRLLVSLQQAAARLSDPDFYQRGTFYFFHTKYSPDGERIMLVLRYPFLPETNRKGRHPTLLTCDRQGEELQEVITRQQWTQGGHHPTWHPDSNHIIMNLTPTWLGEDTLRFCQFRYDGSDFKILSTEHQGSGHPSITPDGRYLLADAYPMEKDFATADGEVPIRLLDLKTPQEHTICTVFTQLAYDIPRSWGPSKLDAHPVWSRDYRQVCFNGAPQGQRQVLVADLSKIV
ncbi:hypothetical protein [Tunicatimonas pelagia]|uniref:hypothetical protein n=1 Tax=Tunicatimonas pelagia TaxID=931531 RepID=UPI002666A150|nr:hypothetical protein [Tunicatimonas pelagia]WKN44858.1 hypothetical protein P0M28_07770 [Tunicatimonas pelagia]